MDVCLIGRESGSGRIKRVKGKFFSRDQELSSVFIHFTIKSEVLGEIFAFPAKIDGQSARTFFNIHQQPETHLNFIKICVSEPRRTHYFYVHVFWGFIFCLLVSLYSSSGAFSKSLCRHLFDIYNLCA